MTDEESSGDEEESEEGQTNEVNLNDGAGTTDSG
jgi:hypothetical protein